MQAKLLRVLQEQELERIGDTRTRKVDVRIIAATNLDLKKEVDNKRFRLDLFYRLTVFPIQVPPLRERREDIPPLAAHFVRQSARRIKRPEPRVTQAALNQLAAYDWPGNIRELQNFVERGVILSTGSVFQPPFMPLRRETRVILKSRKTLEDAMREHILQALDQTKWVLGGRQGTAARLGLARTTLIAKMRRLGIESSRGKGQEAFGATA
jgi:formate hydrogenlyase transcriptional activator